MGWKPVSHKKHHDEKYTPSMVRSLEDGIFVKMRETDKKIMDVEVVIKNG
jgi:hypothetical protein